MAIKLWYGLYFIVRGVLKLEEIHYGLFLYLVSGVSFVWIDNAGLGRFLKKVKDDCLRKLESAETKYVIDSLHLE